MNSPLIADGYRIDCSSGIDARAAAAALLPELAALLPERGQEPVRAAIGTRGSLLRWRPRRDALLLSTPALRAALGADPVHVKIYQTRGAERLLESVTRSRAITSWRLARALREAAVSTPEPLLLARSADASVLVTRALEAPMLLTDALKERLAAKKPARDLLDATAELAAALHEARFLHADLTASNVVFAAGGKPSLIDLDRTRRLPPLPRRALLWIQGLDLRLLLLTTWAEVSRVQWLRLLAHYARARSLSRSEARALARRVLSAKRGRVRIGAEGDTLGSTPWIR